MPSPSTSRKNGVLGGDHGKDQGHRGEEGTSSGHLGAAGGADGDTVRNADYGKNQGHRGADGAGFGWKGRKHCKKEGDVKRGCPKGIKKRAYDNWFWVECFKDVRFGPNLTPNWSEVVRTHWKNKFNEELTAQQVRILCILCFKHSSCSFTVCP